MNQALSGVSVVICTRDRPQLLEGLVTALASSIRDQDEVVIVDSASRDPAVRRIIEAANFPYVRCDVRGAARARNLGVSVTNKDLIACTDDDCVPDAGWTASIGAAFNTDQRIGVVTGRVIPDRHRRLLISVIVDEEERTYDVTDDLDRMGRGANMAFRREALASIGGFDETLGPGGRYASAEDQDAFWRILRAGWLGRYSPGVHVTHRQWRGEGRALSLMFRYGIGRGALLSKMVRLDREHGRSMLRSDLWSRGVHQAMRNVRRGHESGAAGDLLRSAGIVVGLTRARFNRLDGGRFRA